MIGGVGLSAPMARALLVAAVAVAAQAMVGHGPTLKAAIARGQATEVAICAAATGSHECVEPMCAVLQRCALLHRRALADSARQCSSSGRPRGAHEAAAVHEHSTKVAQPSSHQPPTACALLHRCPLLQRPCKKSAAADPAAAEAAAPEAAEAAETMEQ